MKGLLAGVLLTAIAIGFHGTAAYAQASAADLTTTPMTSQSAPLVTQPASINQMPSGAGRPVTSYTSDQLNGVLGILQANPKPTTPPATNSLDSLIQRFSTSQRKPTTIDPIDFFKPPALEGGVKIPIQR
ncbi:hypothetical protein H6F86_08820 [Phormidium sp. FACHB-592]|uniref:Uncharacterized protein n=1 Tax=Stenomitos frigidus AS-A4 TaxID=2933935 RepID=A0ABV0KKJ7_9CYAN|nr:hypothetical protein [Phormidium sp. FACHB-592]MBD2073987.1 hypothetical protein [Phormidium sp. FACHB-592]